MRRLLAILLVTTSLAACDRQDQGAAPKSEERPGAAADPHAGHKMPGKQAATDPHAGHKMPGAEAAADPHAGHAMPGRQAAADPHAGHAMPGRQAAADPHAGHRMAGRQADADPHAGHRMPGRRGTADPHAMHSAAARASGQRQADPHAGHSMPPARSGQRTTAAADPHAGHSMPQARSAQRAPAAADPHAGHAMTPATSAQPAPATADPHAGHAMPAQAQPGAAAAADPHAGHNMPATPPADPHAGHAMPATTQSDPHAGHNMPATAQSDPHAGHDMGASAAVPTAPPPAAAFSGPAHAADLVFGAGKMAQAREEIRREHGDIRTSKVLIDQAEVKLRDGHDGYAWDAQAWYGGDIDKLWIKTEGEGAFRDEVEKAEVQVLWSRAIDPWFDVQLGVRHDFRPDPERTYLVAGVQGLAPYWFEVDGALFLSNKGDVSARLEGEYDLRITQQLILQPRAEVDLALQDVPEIGLGSGLSSAEIGARLRYEITPQFAPYLGVEYERAFGNTARFSRARGEDAGGWSFLLGVRTWF